MENSKILNFIFGVPGILIALVLLIISGCFMMEIITNQAKQYYNQKYSVESYEVWKKTNPKIQLTYNEWVIATKNGNLK